MCKCFNSAFYSTECFLVGWLVGWGAGDDHHSAQVGKAVFAISKLCQPGFRTQDLLTCCATNLVLAKNIST